MKYRVIFVSINFEHTVCLSTWSACWSPWPPLHACKGWPASWAEPAPLSQRRCFWLLHCLGDCAWHSSVPDQSHLTVQSQEITFSSFCSHWVDGHLISFILAKNYKLEEDVLETNQHILIFVPAPKPQSHKRTFIYPLHFICQICMCIVHVMLSW